MAQLVGSVPEYMPLFMFAKRYALDQNMCPAIRMAGGFDDSRRIGFTGQPVRLMEGLQTK
jgi:hypothetical protein